MVLKRSIYLGIIGALGILSSCSQAESGYYEEGAIKELDLLTESIGELNACSFTVGSREESKAGEVTNKFTDAYINGADQMYFYSENEKGRLGVWFNEGKFSLFSFDENKYQTINTPNTVLQTIDSIHGNFKFDFPAADFFYPTFTDDVISISDSIFLNADKMVDGENCKEIFAKSEDREIFILINAETHLPKQLEIYAKQADDSSKTFVATFSNWREDPVLPNSLFQFSPPENAVEAQILKH